MKTKIALFFTLIVCASASAENFEKPGIVPQAITVGRHAKLKIYATIPGVKPESVEVLQLGGHPSTVVGTLQDDGKEPDLVAEDGTYSGSIMVKPDKVGKLGVRTRIKINGKSLYSPPGYIEVFPPVIPTEISPHLKSERV